MNARADDLDAIVRGDHADPFAVLGVHEVGNGLEVRTFMPGARSVEVIDGRTGKKAATLARIRDEGLFAGRLSRQFPYRFRVDWDGVTVELDDPYRFPPILGEVDAHLLAEGNHLDSYRKLGAHPAIVDGVAGTTFAVWAPNARRVSVVGDFNQWDGRRNPMRMRRECGVWEIFVPGIRPGERYKFDILGVGGHQLPLKADPFAFRTETPPQTASIVHVPEQRAWTDDRWMTARAAANRYDAPISIYEVNLGSWRRVAGEGNRFLTYRELAETLVPYVREMNFTHVELMPVTEYPFGGSWGYQPTGMFAPTGRFGGPEDFHALVEAFHAAGIGVILDWVPGHFPSDAHGLAQFDGTHLYEHADPRLGRHMDWDTLIYNYGRREVSNFLLSSALFWLDAYRLDGLRVDAVASMLYLDYSRKSGEWIPNRHGGNENLEAIDFIKRLNEIVYRRFPSTMTIAEESTAWPGVSRPIDHGGLGFGFKWNMGWMHDTLGYMGRDPIHRGHHHDQLTFSLVYAFSENFILPLSHDEVVHGKGSILGRMPGDRWQKFANLRAYYGFMYAHPGKKLLFMGSEIAQEREWNHDASLDWHLLDDPFHGGVQRLVGDLNRIYRTHPALYEIDAAAEGFEWIDASDRENCVLSFLRRGRKPADMVVAVCNFTPAVQHNYRIGVPGPGDYLELINTDAAIYGGSNVGNAGRIHAEPVGRHGRPYSLDLTLPPLAILILKPA